MALIDNLVSYWKLDEASGTRADSHGSNNLTDNNTVTQATGKIGNCADFESTNDEYLSNAGGGSLDITGDFSVSAWIKLETQTSRMGIVTQDSQTGSNRKWSIFHETSGKITIEFFQSSSIYTTIETTNDLNLVDGTWYHFVATVDVSVPSATVYINGSAVSMTVLGSPATSIQSATTPLHIGRGTRSTIEGPFDGLIDEVGIWSKVLTSQEVTDLYNSGSGLAYPFSTSSIKTINGLSLASVKTVNGLAIASVKTVNGLA